MSLKAPNLDDRDFEALMAEAKRRVAQECPDWTDHSPGDPGTVLLELFAHLTEVMIYRINRLPEKVYVELLKLLGVALAAPVSASTTLCFTRASESDRSIEIPQGTRVAAERGGDDGEPVVFVTSRRVILAEGQSEVEVEALHGELIEAELIGHGTGLPAQVVEVRRPPIAAAAGPEQDLVVAVETPSAELDERARAIPHRDKVFRVWQEVDHFANVDAEACVYTVDRAAGTVRFAPSVRGCDEQGLEEIARSLAQLPPAEREIRAWYRRGGGDVGNLAANSLKVMVDPIAGLEVCNPRPATGGRDAESLDNALIRGPQELHGLDRVVKAKDFERLAIRSSGAVARARALTLARMWRHAVAGTVLVVLVPDLPSAIKAEGRISADILIEHQTEDARRHILAALDERRPLGTTCRVQWARYKTVSAVARIVVYREENPLALRQRVLDRLYRTIQPLSSEHVPAGWGFGETLRASHIYDIVLSEPGVKYADGIRLRVDHVPGETRALVADSFQPRTWYASSGSSLLRSVNEGTGWEVVENFGDEVLRDVASHPSRPGLVAVATRPKNARDARLYLSEDCGESWSLMAETAFEVEGIAWLPGRKNPTLLLASDAGLYQVSMERDGPELAEIPVQTGTGERPGFYSVVALVDVHGNVLVAAAAQRTGGVYLSRQGGQGQSFRLIGLQGEDIRRLSIQTDGPNAWLWAAVAAAGNQKGKGCYRWYLTEFSPEGWRAFDAGWTAGSCHDLAFHGTRAVAASHRAGAMRLDTSASEPTWEASVVASSGLPMRDRGRLVPVYAVAVDPEDRWIFAAGPEGVFRSRDGGEQYEALSKQEFDKVTLPETWLFCSGEHEIDVVTEDEADSD
ncbi:MAG: putative baseplate assembly protein [Acidobacteriota bacterium]